MSTRTPLPADGGSYAISNGKLAQIVAPTKPALGKSAQRAKAPAPAPPAETADVSDSDQASVGSTTKPARRSA